MSWTCHLPTLHRTSTHMLGTHAFLVIATLRQSFTSETLDRGDPQIYPYSFLRTRVDQWTFCLYLCLFSTYVHGEPRLDTFHHQIIHLREYSARLHVCSNLFLSVIAFMCEEGHTRDLCFAS